MATTEEPAAIDGEKLEQFVFRAVDEVGATLNAALVVMGDKLGLYRAMAGAGPLTPVELAGAPASAERYVREWLNAQAAGGYVEYDPADGTYTLPPEQADRAHRREQPGLPAGLLPDRARHRDRLAAHHRGGPQRRRRRLARAQPRRVRRAASGSSGPATTPTWSPSWLPALDGVVEKLEARRAGRRHRLRPRRLDDPDGPGVPELDVRRLRLPRRARSRPRASARERGRRRRPRHASRPRRRPSIPATGYDLVTMFDCLHDMGDPVGAARHVREALAADGTWMIVEPMAGDRVEDNLNPVGRAYYGFSTFLCTPASLSQEVGLALGAQAGEARIRDVVSAGGFTPLPARGRDAVQPRVRGAAVTTTIDHVGRSDTETPARLPDETGHRRARRRPGALGGLRARRAGDPAAAHVVDRPLAPLEGADPLPRAALPGGRPSTAAATDSPTGRPRPRPTTTREFVADAIAVLDAAGVERGRASPASRWAASARAACSRRPHPERVLGAFADRRRRADARPGPPRPRRSIGSTSELDELRGLGEVQPPLLAARTTAASSSSSSARCSPSRTRPSRSRTASPGGWTRRPRR